MLVAPEGSGKRTVAEHIVRKLLKLDDAVNLQEHPAVLYIEPVNRSISIETIRQLQQGLQLKTIGRQAIRRVVVIETAHRMTTEAQNALLKLLEEPPSDTVFILTAPSQHSVLPTIYSRSQHIEIKAPSAADMQAYFEEKGFAEEKILAALRYSGQRLGLAHALLKHDTEHPLLTAVASARGLMGSTLLNRLTYVDEWSKQKDELPDKLDALERLCQAGLTQAAEKDDLTLTKRWRGYYQAVYDAKAGLRLNANLKLLLTNLFLRLS
jgi:DNA polymerase-3 subunit delta'